MRTLTKKYINELTYKIIGAAIDVQKEMGPGLLESVYEACMIKELQNRGLKVDSQQTVPITYKGENLDALLRYDLLVEDCIVVELKAVNEFHPIFEAKAMSYARLLQIPKAILINFTCTNIFKEGQKTFVNEFFRNLPDE